MSACISRHGEYSEHTLDGEYTCQRCLVLDEDALRTELRRLRTATTTATVEDATVEQVADALEHWDRGIDWRLAEQENLTRAAYLRGAEQLLGLLARPLPDRDELWEAIAKVRDAAPRRPANADTEDIVDAMLDLLRRGGESR